MSLCLLPSNFFNFHRSLICSSYTVLEFSDGTQIPFIKLLICLLLVKQLATCFKYLKHGFEVFVCIFDQEGLLKMGNDLCTKC